MAPGRSKQVFKQWLQDQPEAWRSRIEVVAMDGFTGSQDRRHPGPTRRDGGDGPLPA
ncbi:transposase [Actinomyces qiguomingii]|uniref:transposase n=1 Tax=Actinomyces qiguomingii TaxID=2057800 RepID=UPI000FFEF7E8